MVTGLVFLAISIVVKTVSSADLDYPAFRESHVWKHNSIDRPLCLILDQRFSRCCLKIVSIFSSVAIPFGVPVSFVQFW